MEYRECGNGHFYDPSVSSTCPQCAAEGRTVSFQEGENIFSAKAAGGYGAAALAEDYGATEPVYGGVSGMPQERSGAPDLTEPSRNGGEFVTSDITKPPADGNGFVTRDFRSDSMVEDYEDVTRPVSVNQVAGFSPVVGWLVCVEGQSRGMDYRIHAGNNYIGRAEHMDICIKGDKSISRDRHAMLACDVKEHLFAFGPVAGKSIVRVNEKMVMVPTELHAHDILQIGETKLLFVPLCGERFSWDE